MLPLVSQLHSSERLHTPRIIHWAAQIGLEECFLKGYKVGWIGERWWIPEKLRQGKYNQNMLYETHKELIKKIKPMVGAVLDPMVESSIIMLPITMLSICVLNIFIYL